MHLWQTHEIHTTHPRFTCDVLIESIIPKKDKTIYLKLFNFTAKIRQLDPKMAQKWFPAAWVGRGVEETLLQGTTADLQSTQTWPRGDPKLGCRELDPHMAGRSWYFNTFHRPKMVNVFESHPIFWNTFFTFFWRDNILLWLSIW